MIETHYQEVETMYRQMRAWRHDYRNHLQAMKALSDQGDMEGLRAYLWSDLADLLLTFLRNGIGYWYLLHITLKNGLPAAQFLLYFSALSGFGTWGMGILAQLSELHQESLDISVLREFLEYPEPFALADGDPIPTPADGKYGLRLEDVSFRYPEAGKDTISHLSLTIRPGEKLAIVGLNGAGKTTLVKLLCGFLDPTEGRVLLNDRNVRSFNRKQYYGLFSAVFQDFSVLGTTLSQNVAQQMDGIDTQRVRRCLELAGLTEKVAALPKGLDTPIGRRVYEDGVELSSGQTQRLMLARALYKNGAILALDEPTAALDPIAEDDIYRKYNAMAAGKTALFISHRLASTRFCNRILFLKDGRIAEEGTHQQLLEKNGEYARLFAVQSRYYQKGGDTHEAE